MPTTTATELAQLGGLVTTDSSTSTVTVNGTLAATTITLPNNSVTAAKLSNPQYTGFRNRIINGDMRVWQRGTTVTPSLGSLTSYVSDRWASYQTGAALAVGRSSGFVSGANAFQYAASLTGAAGNTEATFFQCIESLNTADLSGQTITLSVWLYSGIAKSINLFIDSADVADVFSATTNRSAVAFSHTGSGWEKAILTYVSANSAVANGIRVRFSFGALTSGVFGFTGVQLEAGSTATDFERRPIGTELALCQRYFQSYGGQSANDMVCMGTTNSTSNFLGIVHLPVTMRTNPTVGFSAASAITIDDNGAGAVSTGITTAPYGLTSVALVVATPAVMAVNRASRAYINGSSPRLTWSAEL